MTSSGSLRESGKSFPNFATNLSFPLTFYLFKWYLSLQISLYGQDVKMNQKSFPFR